MKLFLGICGFALLLLAGGCAEPGYVGYGGSVYGEYPDVYYGSGYDYSYAPVYPYTYHYRYAPYDRDHYFDHGNGWDRYHRPYHHDWPLTH
jgi:hypothetical protein